MLVQAEGRTASGAVNGDAAPPALFLRRPPLATHPRSSPRRPDIEGRLTRPSGETSVEGVYGLPLKPSWNPAMSLNCRFVLAVAAAVLVSSTAATMRSASAGPLSPAAGDRVAQNASFVASEIQDAIADGETDAAENLRRFIDTDDAFRVYHRDHQVLVAMTTRRNLFVGDKRAGERQAAEMVRAVLQEKFTHLLETEDGFLGLDPNAVRVVFVEPDAFEDCPGRRPSRVGGTTPGQAPVPFAGNGLWSNGWATPAPCTNCQ